MPAVSVFEGRRHPLIHTPDGVPCYQKDMPPKDYPKIMNK